MKAKLKDYGFSDRTAAELLKGKKVDTPYGVVKLNRKTGELITKYHIDKREKIEAL